jgi:hypothetical protein
VDGNIVVMCGQADAFSFLVSLYIIEGKWQNYIYKESIGCRRVIKRVVGENVWW